jgi:hypothetical protein
LNQHLDDPDVPEVALHEFHITGRDGIFQIEWPSLQVTARIDRLKESSDFEVKGEVIFTSQRPTSAGHLRQGRIILTSPASRRTMVKALEERDAGPDWDRCLEQLCMAVLTRHRAGSPEVELHGDADLEAADTWLISPLVQTGGNPTLIYGSGSSGKSWLGQYLATLADAGISLNGLGVEPCPGRVLFLDWETTEREISSRITMIRRGLSLEGPSHIWYKRMEQSLAADIETVRNIVINRNIQFLIVDSLGSACGGEPESASITLNMYAALRSLNVSSLCIHHTTKENQLFGSVYHFNSARMAFEQKKSQDPDSNQLVFGLFHRKANNSKLIKDMGFQIQFGLPGGGVAFTRMDVGDTALDEHQRLPDRIFNILKRGPVSVADLAEDLQKTENHIRKELSNGVRAGRFLQLKDGSGRYALRAVEQPPERRTIRI